MYDKDTQEAIELAKKGKPQTGLDKEKLKKEVSKQNTKTTKKETPKEQPKIFKGKEVKLGENKVVHISPWTGKTKKKFRKLFEFVESYEDIDFPALIKTLIYDYLDKSERENIYLNDGEQQYLLVKIKEISIDNKIEGEFNCPACESANKIKTVTEKAVKYKLNELPKKYNDEIEFVDIPGLKFFEEITNEIITADDYDGITTKPDIEVACHIKVKDKTVKDVIEYLDEMPLNETKDLMEEFHKTMPKCDVTIRKECDVCKKTVDFDLDVTQGIFEELMR
jgi:hypothetical protein